MAAVTGTDCTYWSLANEAKQQLNLDQQPLGDPALIGTVACDQDGICAEVYAVGAPAHGVPPYYCLRHVSGPPFNTNSQNRTPTIGLTPTRSPYWFGGRAYMNGSSGQPANCPKIPGTFVGGLPVWASAYAGPQYWAVDIRASSNAIYVHELPNPLRSNPLRTLRCVVNPEFGTPVSGSTGTFTLGSSQIPKPNCPALSPGVLVASVELWLDTSGQSPLLIGYSETSSAFEDWAGEFASCLDGGCVLDLRKGGDSCFSAVDCEGWLDDPNRDSTYSCFYADEPMPLSDCYIYGPLFEPSGPAYGDYTTGTALAVETVPSEVDELTRDLLTPRGWLVHGPTPGDYVYGVGDEIEHARVIATACVARGLQDECRTLPIFAPGDDVWEAAVHDRDAIASNPSIAVLEHVIPSPVTAGWYSNTVPCNVPYGPELQCDEYPFKSTTLAGPPTASIRLIDSEHNHTEGVLLNLFYSQCGVGSGEQFVVVPVPTAIRPPVPITSTSAWCLP